MHPYVDDMSISSGSTTRLYASPRAITGFTLVEVLIVMSVIAALAAISLPVLSLVKDRAKRDATSNLLVAIDGAITASDVRVVRGSDGVLRRAWSLGWPNDAQSGEIDGDPTAYPSGHLLPSRAPSTYRGLVEGLSLELQTAQVDAQRRPIDAWGRPLRLAYIEGGFGGRGHGVWSAGPDGVDAALDQAPADDLRSWSQP